jgi:hypothetical protein
MYEYSSQLSLTTGFPKLYMENSRKCEKWYEHSLCIMHTFKQTNTHTHTHIYIYIYTYASIYTYTHTHTHTNTILPDPAKLHLHSIAMDRRVEGVENLLKTNSPASGTDRADFDGLASCVKLDFFN